MKNLSREASAHHQRSAVKRWQQRPDIAQRLAAVHPDTWHRFRMVGINPDHLYTAGLKPPRSR
jgi:hypothetical protein